MNTAKGIVALLSMLLALHAPGASAMSEAELRATLQLPEGAAVKNWPGVPDRTIVAWTVQHPDPTRTPEQLRDESSYDRTLMIVKTSTGEVMQKLFDAQSYTSDAIEFEGIGIDTANYALAPGHRAFGLRVATGHRGCAGFDGDALELFDVQGKAIVRVASLDMSSHSQMCGGCGEYRLLDRTVAVGTTRANGYADLVVREKVVEADDGRMVDGACVQPEKKSQRQMVLHYDGRAYPEPPDPPAR